MNAGEQIPRHQAGAVLLWALGALVLVFALAVAGAPLIAKWYLEHWLRDRGVVNVTIDDIDLNPFAGRFAIKSISYEELGQRRSAERAIVDLQWPDLAQRRIRLSEVRLEGARLAVRRTESQGLFLGTIALGAARAAQEAEQTQQESDWGFGIDSLTLRDVLVDYEDPLVVQRVLFEELVIEDFATWAPDRATRLLARLSAEEQRLDVSGELAPLADPWAVDLRIRGQELDIARLGQFLGNGVTTLTGRSTSDIRAQIRGPEGEAPTRLSLAGAVAIRNATLEDADASGEVASVSWDGDLGLELAEAGTQVTADGTLSVAGSEVTLPEAGGRIGVGDLKWQGRLEARTGQQATTLTGDGRLTSRSLTGLLTPSAADDASAPVPVSLELAAIDLQVDMLRLERLAGGLDAQWDGALILDTAAAAREPRQGTLASLEWRGRLGMAGPGRVSADGGLVLGPLILADDAAPLETRLDALSWTGTADVSLADNGRLALTGEITAGPWQAARGAELPALLKLGAMRGVLEADGPVSQVDFSSLRFEDLALIEQPGSGSGRAVYVARIPALEIAGASVGASRADFGTVTLLDGQFRLERDPDGNMILGSVAADDTGGSPEEVATPATARGDRQSGYPFSLDGITMTGQSRVQFVDRSVQPAVELTLSPLNLTVGTIDSSRPDSETNLALDSGIGEFTTLGFEGTARPLARDVALRGEGQIRSLDLVELDGYSRRNTGYRIDSGTLRADLDIDLGNGRLDSLARLKIFNLELVRLRAEEKDEFSQELGVPLPTALDLLRDKENTITLDVPLEGELDNLRAGIGDALRVVMNKGLQAGIKAAATAYFAPLWPALAASKLLEAASNLSFQPVEFVPGDAALGADQTAYLDQMQSMLLDRPKLSVTVCGRAVGADQAALFPGTDPAALTQEQSAALVELARERNRAVKTRLVGAGVEASRVVTCAPRATPADPDAPRADFGG
jgi:hypothetical protein